MDADACRSFLKNLWPITIATTRYGGVIEGGKWVAFSLTPDEVPDEAFGSNIPAHHFWESYEAKLVGRGSTPQEALDDLVKRIKEMT